MAGNRCKKGGKKGTMSSVSKLLAMVPSRLNRPILYAIILVIVLCFALIFDHFTITGKFVFDNGLYTVNEDVLNLIADKDMTYEWEMKQHPQNFLLKGLQINGRIMGEGNAKIFLSDGKHTYLVLDSDNLDSPMLSDLTGYLFEEDPMMDEGDAEATNSSPISINLEYASGTEWDSDDNGITEMDDVVDLTVENTVFNEQLGSSTLCTKWQVSNLETLKTKVTCHGYELCCNFIGVNPEENSWDDPLYVMPSEGSDLSVSAQVMYINYSLDVDNPYKKILYSSIDSLPVKFIPVIDESAVEFNDVGEETSFIEEGLSSSQYTFIFQMDPGMKIYLDEVSYALEGLPDIGEEAELNVEIKDSNYGSVPAVVTLMAEDGTIEAEKDMRSMRGRALGIVASPQNNVNVPKGKYKAVIELSQGTGPIKKIELNDMQVSEDDYNFIKIDDVNETGKYSKYAEVYAIDPTAINFTNATVTVEAKGSVLYKCKDWDFVLQECNGNWDIFKTDLVPGEEYNFTLTPDDPGFAEGIPSIGTPDNGWVDDQAGDDEEGGSYVQTQVYDGPQTKKPGTDYYFIIGEQSNKDEALSYIVLEYDISNLGLSPTNITGLRFDVSYCHSGEDKTHNSFCDDDDPVEKSPDGPQNVEVYNYQTSSWVDIGDLIVHSDERMYNLSFNATGNLANYVNLDKVKVRYEAKFDDADNGDAFLAIDYAPMTVEYIGGPPAVICGDGNLGVGEECDDGNTNDGDGCNNVCSLEPCECDGGLKFIELQTALPYTGGTEYIEARAAKKDKLDDPGSSDYYGADFEIFDGTTITQNTFNDAVSITRIESNGTHAIVTFIVNVTKIGKDKMGSETDFRVSYGNISNEQRIHVSCSQDIAPPFVFGDFRLLSYVDKENNHCGSYTPGLICGNNILEAEEQCDDGNTNNGDGCSANCNLEDACIDNDGDGYNITNAISAPAMIEVESDGNIIAPPGDMDVEVMAAEITYGEDSPEIDVTVKLIKDNVKQTLFGGVDVDGGELYAETLTSTTDIAIEGRAKYGTKFDQTYRSDVGSDHVIVLQDGDDLPNVPTYGGQTPLSTIIGPFVDEFNKIDLDINQVLVLYEFASLNSEAADFQDLVVLMTFDPDNWTVDCGPWDCDDSDPAVNPGATEICNFIDDDCDFLVDEGFPPNCQFNPLNIIAHKIVCEDESDLPNWGKGGPDITSTTAQDFVNSHPDCEFEQGWKFQWAFGNQDNPGDHVGEAGDGWNTFGPTNANGKAEVSINDLQGFTLLKVREVFKPDYINFTYNLQGDNSDNVSAEMYCHADVLNYDNYDFIVNAQSDMDYYCVGFNALACDPNATEWCDGIDNDCDGEIDEDCVVNFSVVYSDNGQRLQTGLIATLNGQPVYSNTSIRHDLILRPGSYDFAFTTQGRIITNVELFGVNINKTGLYELKVDESVPEDSINLTGVLEAFAIDPSGFEFRSGQVTTSSIPGNTLFKCFDWNNTSRSCNEICEIEDGGELDCQEDWVFIGDLIENDPYFTFNITALDPGYATTNQASDVAVAPINDTAFVLAWVDKTQWDISFRIMNTNGSVIVNTVDVDSSVDIKSRVSVAMINSTHFTIAWVDGPSEDVTYAIYDINGNNIKSATDVDNDVEDESDVSVAQLGDKFAVCYANEDDEDADFKIYNNDGTLAVGETNVDDDMDPDDILFNLVDCTGFVNNRFTYFWFDNKGNDATFKLVNDTGVMETSQIDIDTNVGSNGQVATATLDGDKFVMLWHDYSEKDITIAIRDNKNNIILAPTDIDTDSGKKSRVAVSAVRRPFETSDSFVAVWWDQKDKIIEAAIYDGNGTQTTAPFIVDTQASSSFRLMDVTSKDPVAGTEICSGTFVIAYANSSNLVAYKAYNVNGTPWDGVCDNKPPYGPPTASIISPLDGSNFRDGDLIIFSVLATSNGTIVNYDWASTINGSIGSTMTFNRTDLSLGKHNISVVVTDDYGQTATDTITITILDNDQPTASITQPNDGDSFKIGQPISFSGIGGAENITGYAWESSLDGSIGTSQTFSTAGLSLGNHTITFTVFDDDGQNASDSITIRVVPLQGPTVSILSPFDASQYKENQTIMFNAIANDTDGTITKIIWDSSVQGNLINGTLIFNTSTLATGLHTITVTVYDDDNQSASDSITITVNPLQAPVVSILNPNEGDNFVQGANVLFSALGYDPDGYITSWEWTSNIDGQLAVTGAGNTSIFNTSALSLGSHDITITVRDNDNLTYVDTFTINININPLFGPTASIISPLDGSNFRDGDNIIFSGVGTDPNGYITDYTWVSNRDGTIGSNMTFNLSTLSLGVHTITFTVTDNDNQTDSDSITITVLDNDQPTASILNPNDGDHFKTGHEIQFSGLGDNENITAYTWTSNLEGTLSTNDVFNISTLGLGEHIITFTVFDDDGQSDSDSITITVDPLKAPIVSIVTPSDGDDFRDGDNITFSGVASDPDGIIVDYQWQSNLDGVIGENTTFSLNNLSLGLHTITFIAVDDDNQSSSDSIQIEVKALQAPIVSILNPNDGDHYIENQSILFSAIGSDPDGYITKWTWSSSIDGLFYNQSGGNVSTFFENGLSLGTHDITVTVVDNDGLQYVDTFTIVIDLNPLFDPTASIISPLDGSVFRDGDNIIFSGLGDDRNGFITDYHWASNIDGTIGNNMTFNISSLSLGVHTITFTVTDNDGRTGDDSIIITILDNDAPTASIINPNDGDNFKSNHTINFAGLGDNENITAYLWTSNLQGTLSTSDMFSTANLTVGQHTITFTVTDDDGQTGSDSIIITVNPLKAPTASIISPIDQADYKKNQSVYFEGFGSDPDGTIEYYYWESNVDGMIGNQSMFSLTDLSLGYHTITFTVVDNDGLTSSDSVEITVKPLLAPTASIVHPNNGDHFKETTEIPFVGSGSDPDGFIVQWIWSSNIDGLFGSQKEFNYSGLSLGRHDITLTVVDNDGLRYTDTFTIWIEIDPSLSPNVTITSPIDGETYKNNTLFTFSSNITDDGTIDSYVWSSSVDGILSSGVGMPSSFTDQLSLGYHAITLLVTDDDNLTNSDTIYLWVVPLLAPNVTITSPVDGAVIVPGTSINFSSIIIDDGNITQILWNSDLDGNFGNSTTFNFSGLSLGEHRITLFVTDDDNLTTVARITILIATACGNGIIDAGEQCDGIDLNSKNCRALGFTQGTLRCTNACTFAGCFNGGGGGGGGGGTTILTTSTPEEIPECIPEESCTDWSECIEGNMTRTCSDGCGESRTEEMPCGEKNLSVTLVNMPSSISLEDKEFTVSARVENTGQLPLDEIEVSIETPDAWSTEPKSLGGLDVGQSQTIEFRFKNDLCSGDSFAIGSTVDLDVTASESEVSDSDSAGISLKLPRITVLTDRPRYKEGDIMRSCIVFSNVGEDAQDKLEFEINLYKDRGAPYMLDINPSSVDADKILVFTRDFNMRKIPSTGSYKLEVKAFGGGKLFDNAYNLGTGSAEVFLNGFVEEQVLTEEKEVHKMLIDEEEHTLTVQQATNDFVQITIASTPTNYTLKLLETIMVDVDKDGEDDISVTYLGMKDGKADIRTKLLPKKPMTLTNPIASYQVELGEKTPDLEKPQVLDKEPSWDRMKSFIAKIILRTIIVVLIIFLLICIIFTFCDLFDIRIKFIERMWEKIDRYLNNDVDNKK